jgi:hypothetical protein
LLVILCLTPCRGSAQEPGKVAGYWEGKGAIWERPIDDAVRRLTRRSETEFWFVCDNDGACKGETTTAYSAELDAIKWSIPLPTGGSIEAAVEGTSEKTKFTYPIEGSIAGGKLQLRAAGESADMVVPNASFEFVLHAVVGMPTMGAAPSLPAPQITVIRIPAKGWSPFQGLQADITKRPHGPLVGAAKSAGEKFSIEWQVQRNPTYDLDALADELAVILEAKLLARLEPQLEETLLAKLEPTLEVHLEPKLEVNLEAKLEPKLEVRLEPKLEAKLEVNLGPKLEATLAPKLEVDLGPKLEATLEPKLEVTLEGKLEPKLEATLKPKLEVELKPEIEVELRPEIQAEISKEIQTSLVEIQQEVQVLQQKDTKQDGLIAALEAVTLTIRSADRTTGKPVALSSIEIRGEHSTFYTFPSTEEGVLALRLPKGHYNITVKSGERQGTASVDLQEDQAVKVEI